MSESTPRDRLQPFLLQRLKDDSPGVPESRERRVVSPAEYRRALLEDLASLLNSGNHVMPDELVDYPNIVTSVLNYGVTELAGMNASGQTADAVAKMVQNAILNFEPRILRRSLSVKPVTALDESGAQVIELEIRGEIWNVPAPESLYIRTAVDLETGHYELRDSSFGR